MTHRPKLHAAIVAAFVSVTGCIVYGQSQQPSTRDTAKPAAASPNAATAVTTTGGTANKVAKFSGSSTLVNSILYDNGTQVGVGTTSPTATLAVNGTLSVSGSATVNGQLGLPAGSTATASSPANSHSLKFTASAFNSSSGTAVSPSFQLLAEPFSNDSAAPGATLNLVASPNSSAPVETGLYINTNGTIHFAPSQTFPEGGAFCVATNGGFGNGGTTFVAPALAVPAAGKCSPWSGFTKTAGTVVLMTSGVACLSTDQKKLTVSVTSADPEYLGTGTTEGDFIQLTRTSTTGNFGSGSDTGQYFGGAADQITCTTSLLQLNENND